jgi:molybdenum cofactor cytidylyltransferase
LTIAADIPLILLAAGGSSRLGRPKQLLPYDGGTLLRHAVATALTSPCRPVVAVIGAHAEQMRAEMAGFPVEIVENTAWTEGLSTSIRAGVDTAIRLAPAAGAVVLMLCDQPRVTPALIEELVRAHEAGASIAASAYAGTVGVPALFAKRFFTELIALTRDQGAKRILAGYADEVMPVAFPEGALDIDTEAEYQAFIPQAEGAPDVRRS